MNEVMIRSWLVSDADAGLFFLEDVWTMLCAKALRSGAGELTPPGRHDESDLRAPLTEELSRALASEIGLHRAQFVRPRNQLGRVETALAAVEVLFPGSDPTLSRPEAPILRTYNYGLGSVTTHATGERHQLSAVLSGDAD